MAVRIKGQSFIGFLATLRELRGEEPHRAVMSRLPGEVANALKSGEIVPMGWYPVEWYAALHAAARAVEGEGVSRYIGREAARKDVNTIYRFVLKFLSPETLLKQSAKVFSLFCDGGKCDVTSTQKGSARIRYSECPGACRGMWDVVLGGTEVIVELCGGKNVSSRAINGGGEGDTSLLVQITWT
jgi:hypothetical protein